MSEFINTADVIGDDEMCDQIIMRTVTEYKENRITKIGKDAFNGCNALTVLDIPNVTTVGDNAFCGIAVETLNLPLVTSLGSSCCRGAVNIKALNAPELLTMGNYSFDGAGLTSINCPKLLSTGGHSNFAKTKVTEICFPAATTVGYNTFSTCTKLVKADFPVATKIDQGAFDGCTALETLILRADSICALANGNVTTAWQNPLYGTPIAAGTGYVYAPRAQLTGYAENTNWVSFDKVQFRALEDYTVDGTTTGELDESKI